MVPCYAAIRLCSPTEEPAHGERAEGRGYYNNRGGDKHSPCSDGGEGELGGSGLKKPKKRLGGLNRRTRGTTCLTVLRPRAITPLLFTGQGWVMRRGQGGVGGSARYILWTGAKKGAHLWGLRVLLGTEQGGRGVLLLYISLFGWLVHILPRLLQSCVISNRQ